jgi:hypothetical protein
LRHKQQNRPTFDFTILAVPDRLVELGDLWAGILDAKTDLAKASPTIAPRS